MDYYWLISSTGKDIGRSSSQVKEMSNGNNLYADNSVWNIPILKKMNFKPNLDSFVLYHNRYANLQIVLKPRLKQL